MVIGIVVGGGLVVITSILIVGGILGEIAIFIVLIVLAGIHDPIEQSQHLKGHVYFDRLVVFSFVVAMSGTIL